MIVAEPVTENPRMLTEPISEKFEGGMPFQPAKSQKTEVVAQNETQKPLLTVTHIN